MANNYEYLNTWRYGKIRIVSPKTRTIFWQYIDTDCAYQWDYYYTTRNEVVAMPIDTDMPDYDELCALTYSVD